MSTKINLTAKDLAGLLRPVLPHAGKADTLPILSTVYITSEPGRLIATATDRYTLGIQRRSVEGVKPGLRAALPTEAVKTMLKMFRVTRSYNPDLTLTFEDHKVTVEAVGFALDGMTEARVAFHLAQGEYPAASIAGLVKAKRGSGDAGLNPTFLARFGAAQTEGEPMIVKTGGSQSPTYITVGVDFIGLIMPMRGATTEVEPADWDSTVATLAQEPTAPAKPKRAGRKAEAVPA